jgi:hypothetical protein
MMTMTTLPMILGLIAAGALLLATLVVLAVFLRATSGTRGLRQRIERLFRLPERGRPLGKHHYYHPYWRER